MTTSIKSSLDVQDLQVELDTDAGVLRAIDGLSLSMARGETFALVGESGCGKSMTALALMRLLPDNGRIPAGRVMLDGVDALGLPERDMRSLRGGRIAMIFQEPGTSLNPVLKVGIQLIEAIETHTPLRGDAARAKAIEWLARVGIPEPARRIDDYPFRMSGGQKQRVMIAMALATEPDFLIADEPTTALDVTIQKQILDLLQQLQTEQGMGMLLITHDLAVVAQVAHRVALMYAGQIVEVAGVREFFASPKHPYASLLLAALPDARHKGQALSAITGSVPAMTVTFEGCRFAPRCKRARGAWCCTGTPADACQCSSRDQSVARAVGRPLVEQQRTFVERAEPARAVFPANWVVRLRTKSLSCCGGREFQHRTRVDVCAGGRIRLREDHRGQSHRAAFARRGHHGGQGAAQRPQPV
jgi:peptide/nickel transport system ATP-binding protein